VGRCQPYDTDFSAANSTDAEIRFHACDTENVVTLSAVLRFAVLGMRVYERTIRRTSGMLRYSEAGCLLLSTYFFLASKLGGYCLSRSAFPRSFPQYYMGCGCCHWDLAVAHSYLLLRPSSTATTCGCYQKKNVEYRSTSTSFLSYPIPSMPGSRSSYLTIELPPLFWTSPGWLLEGRHDDGSGHYVIRIIPAHPCPIPLQSASYLGTNDFYRGQDKYPALVLVL
jgi:hypothetical protein